MARKGENANSSPLPSLFSPLLPFPPGRRRSTRLLLSAVPLNTLLEPDPRSTKAIQGASDSEVDLALAELVHFFKVLEVAPAAGISDGYAAPLGQLGDELLVHASLETLVVGRMDQKLGAVRLELSNRV